MTKNLKSMTGFGRARAGLGGRTIGIEIRSLNHRGLDIKLRPHDLQLCPEIEIEVFRLVRASVSRGSIAIVFRDEAALGSAIGGDLDRLRKVYAVLDELRKELGLAQPVDLAVAAAFLGATRSSAGQELTMAEWPALETAFAAALSNLSEMRANEGAAIRADLELRTENMRGLVEKIAALVPAVPARAGQRLQERLTSLLGPSTPLDLGRVAQEVALLADRSDVSEEIARLRAHLDHITSLLDGGQDTPGRRIDFLVQEVGREINTLGGKIQDTTIAALVIDTKAELEKLREQVQNIE